MAQESVSQGHCGTPATLRAGGAQQKGRGVLSVFTSYSVEGQPGHLRGRGALPRSSKPKQGLALSTDQRWVPGCPLVIPAILMTGGSGWAGGPQA